MTRLRFNTLFGGFLLLLMSACSTFNDDGRISEGIIEFEVTYPKLDPNSILSELLPTKMTMSFKDNQYTTDFSAGFGMFRMNMISNSDEKKMSQMVKLINERFAVNYEVQDVINSIKKRPIIEFEYTDKTKIIAGFECKEVIASVQNDTTESYTIYYTNEIRLDHPNWFTELAEIDGVMLEYQVERYDLCSRFRAIKVLPKEIDDEIFEISEAYKVIQEDEMDKKMDEIFNNFSE